MFFMSTGSYFLLGGKVQLYRNAHSFGASVDSVLLAAAGIEAKTVLDIGAGTGSVCLCYAALHENAKIDALELQEDAYDLLVRNIGLNNFGYRVRGVHGDLFNCGLESESYDLLLTNPPYLRDFHPFPEANARALAKSEQGWNLDDWIGKCLKLVCRKGWLVMIHRSDRLYDVLESLKGKVDRFYIYPVFSKKGESALRFIICVRKKSSRSVGLSPPLWYRGLVMHNDEGGYTAEADMILRGNKKDLLQLANR